MNSCAMTMTKKNEMKRKVRFDRRVRIKKTRPHSYYTAEERLSTWYTKEEYRSFKVREIRESLQPTNANATNRYRSPDFRTNFGRTQHIDSVRDVLLRAQDVQRKISRNGMTMGGGGDYSGWLADFYKKQSEPCALDALRRGIEMSREGFSKPLPVDPFSLSFHATSSSHLSGGSITCGREPISYADYGSLRKKKPYGNKVRFSVEDPSSASPQCKRFSLPVGTKSFNDRLQRSKHLRKFLGTDPNFWQLPHPQKRWSATITSCDGWRSPAKRGSVGSSSLIPRDRDFPLKPLKHVITPPFLCIPHAA